MYNEKVERVIELLIELLPEFQTRRKGDVWKRLTMTFAEIFPEDRQEILQRIREIVLPDSGEKKPTKLEQVQAGLIGKKKRQQGESQGEDYGCENCPKKQISGKAIPTEEVARRKQGRAERMGGFRVVRPDRFTSAEDVLERFESNVIAMLNFCQNMDIPVGSTQEPEALAAIIFENYKG